MKNLILIAPPAAGKGTISSELLKKYHYKHISTGDILRNASKENEEVKKLLEDGKLIPDSIILPLFKKELINISKDSFILDGIPRTVEQAEYLKKVFEELNVDNYVVINIDISYDTLEKRVIGRRVCETCKNTYNVYFNECAPKEENVCDVCGGRLITRSDDTKETFKVRYETYLNETAPLISYYKNENKLYVVNASVGKDNILKEVEDILL